MSRHTRYASDLIELADRLEFDVRQSSNNHWEARDRHSKGIARWASTSCSNSGFLNARAWLLRIVRNRGSLQ